MIVFIEETCEVVHIITSSIFSLFFVYISVSVCVGGGVGSGGEGGGVKRGEALTPLTSTLSLLSM